MFHQWNLPPKLKEYPFLEKIKKGEPFNWNLPRQNILFIGRSSLLWDLELSFNHHEIKGKEEQRKIRAINAHGLGGVGKTQLALKYAHDTKQSYTLKAWFPSENVLQLREKYLEFSKILGYENDDITGAIKHVKYHLEKYSGWLLIYDNVEKYEDIEPFLPEHGGNILITTRNVDPPSIDIGRLLIGVMEEGEAITVVENITNRKDFEIKNLVFTLGYLPLALAQASAYIQLKKKTVAEYLELYKKYEGELLADDTLPTGVNHAPVAITWNTSLAIIEDDLRRKNMPSLATDLITIFAYFAPEDIPRKIDPGCDIFFTWFQKANPMLNGLELILDEILMRLNRFSLINLSEKNLSIHRLVQAVLRHQYNQKGKKEGYSLIKHIISSLNEHYFFYDTSKETILKLNKLSPHVLSVMAHIDDIQLNNTEKEADEQLELCLKAGSFLNHQKRYLEAAKVLLVALQIAKERIYSKQKVVYRNLLNTYMGTGDWKKIGLIPEQYRGDLDQLASISHHNEKNFEKAKELYEQSLNAKEWKEEWKKAGIYKNLGDLYLEWEKKETHLELAISSFEKAKAIYEKLNWETDVAYVLWKLGISYEKIGTPKKAVDFLTASLKKYEFIDKEHESCEKIRILITNIKKSSFNSSRADISFKPRVF